MVIYMIFSQFSIKSFLWRNTDNYVELTFNNRSDRSEQTVQTQIRLLIEEQSDQGLHCLLFHLHQLFHLHHFDEIPLGFASLSEF